MLMQRPAREAPAAPPLYHDPKDPAFPDVVNRPLDRQDEVPPEPELNIKNIQGNSIAGFMKDFQTSLFLDITHPEEFKQWLRSQIPFVSTAAQVLAFNEDFKHTRAREGEERNTLKATWMNIAFSAEALGELLGQEKASLGFADKAFIDGLAERSRKGVLGDPQDPGAVGNAQNWVVGGPNNEADVLILVAADDRGDMLDEVERIKTSLEDNQFLYQGRPGEPPARILFEEEGANLPQPLSGHEHFGFLDGVSNPGIRGRVSDDTHDVLMPRQNPLKRDQSPKLDAQGNLLGGDEKNRGDPAQGKPGQDLLWPGEFVFGYQKQDPTTPKDSKGNELWDGPNPIPNPQPELRRPASKEDRTVKLDGIAPEWARDGSFLVFRRLRQDVFAFHTFLNTVAAKLRDDLKLSLPRPEHSSLEREIGASLVGRWTSGAPVERARAVKKGSNPPAFDPAVPDDDPNLADDDCANNFFEYQAGEERLPDNNNADPFKPETDPFACTDKNSAAALDPTHALPDHFIKAPNDKDDDKDGDKAGTFLPFTGHIRKAYPRDDESDGVGQSGYTPDPKGSPCNKDDGDDKKRQDVRQRLNESDTQTHRLIRRGIPFGPVSRSTPEAPIDDGFGAPVGSDRGLHFISYQTSIENQFEFIIRCWVNNKDFKERFAQQKPSTAVPQISEAIDPQKQGGGHDPIIGQNDASGESRVRTFTIAFNLTDSGKTVRQLRQVSTALVDRKDWVIPTGGGYFFSPSVQAMQDKLT